MSNKITGQVRSASSKISIKDVIVVFYDLDIGKGTSPRNDPPLNGENSVVNSYLKFLYQSNDNEEDPQIKGQPQGDRLGSVITDKNGRFNFEFDDSDFQRSDKELRPDLLIIVAAPDKTLRNTNKSSFPLGTPELQRLLHVSFFPARNIGRSEEFIIEISQESLERNEIGLVNTIEPDNFAKALAAPTERKRLIRSALRKELKIDETIQKSRKRSQKAEAFSRQISAVSKAQRQSRFFVGNNVNKADVINLAERAGLASLVRHSESNLRKPSARLHFSDEHLEAMGISGAVRQELDDALENGDVYSATLNVEKFCASIQERNGGTVLERTASMLDPSRIKHSKRLEKLDDTESEIEPHSDTDPDPSLGSDTVELSAEEQIKQLVMAQVAKPNSEPECPIETDQSARVLRNLQTLQPPASPADITAFHDFTHLQIAFPDIWSEAFDRDVRDILRLMHNEYQEIEEEYSAENPASVFGESVLDIDPDELLDLKEYTDLMQKLGADLLSVSSVGDVPAVVRSFYSRRLPESTPQSPPRERGGRRIARVRTSPRSATQQEDSIDESAVAEISTVWPLLSLEQQQELFELATASANLPNSSDRVQSLDQSRQNKLFNKIVENLTAPALSSAVDLYEQLDSETIGNDELTFEELHIRAQQIVTNPAGRVSRVQRLLTDLARRLSEPHSFRVFEKDSINFGIMTTYRQKWVPGPYQVGDLVSTLPMAPGETKKYTKRESIKKTNIQKENENYSSTIKDERSITSRAISDIVDKASSTSNFQQAVGTQAGGSLFGFNVSATTSTQFQANQATESQRVKKDFREAVRKASQEFKNERAIEVSTEQTIDSEFSSSGEISNPNNEITVTYLFYELERQYRVTEHLQRLTPVVMVAQEVPNPSDIDEDWLLAHEWILRRSLLDRGFADALDYISEGLISDEINLEARRDAFETQKALVDNLEDNVEALSEMQKTLRDTLVQTSEREKLARVAKARAKKRRRSGILKKIFLPVPGIAGKLASGTSNLGFGRRGEDPEALEARREALETRLKFLEGNLEDGRAQLTRASTALENATEALTSAVDESFTKRNLVSQLRIHVKDNILHYMQMIWSYEPPDQRFFRLYDNMVRVPVSASTARFEFFNNELNDEEFIFLGRSWDNFRRLGVHLPIPETWVENRRLHEIADLDKPLGFKGNYMIFPLKECVYLTDYMMQDYVDDYLGVRDPDPVSGVTTEELLRHAEDIWHKDQTTEEQKTAIRSIVQARLTSPRLEDELIVVPTGQLFIEALKGEHALLENFKLKHRELDMAKVNEEVNAMQIENLRKAARLVSEVPNFEDPDVDKNVVVSGVDNINIET